MASQEHIALSDFIKSVHLKLRHDAKILGSQVAWENHLKHEENLGKYAENMRKLATEHWQGNSVKDSKAVSRIKWVFEASMAYFVEIDKFRAKEVDILKKNDNTNILDTRTHNFNIEKLNLLDVGSCYNPFKEFTCFNVTAIDIAPACSDVLKCDFLNVSLGDKNIFVENVVLEIQKLSYDIVVFSLLLEYLPDVYQRKLCCEKAYSVLKPEGILMIITPDSKHVGANAKLMKSWRLVLGKMGFIRVKYEKLPYIHCMVFRKAIVKEVAQRWAKIHENSGLYEEIFIPQDFNSDIKVNCEVGEKEGQEWVTSTFLEDIMDS